MRARSYALRAAALSDLVHGVCGGGARRGQPHARLHRDVAHAAEHAPAEPLADESPGDAETAGDASSTAGVRWRHPAARKLLPDGFQMRRMRAPRVHRKVTAAAAEEESPAVEQLQMEEDAEGGRHIGSFLCLLPILGFGRLNTVRLKIITLNVGTSSPIENPILRT